MVDFKAVINDVQQGQSFNVDVTGHHANSLLGRKIGEDIDGIFVGLPGYKLKITGGSDKDGTPMRKDLPGQKRRKILVSDGLGFHPKYGGERRRKAMMGNTISNDVSQINMKVTQYGSKGVEETLNADSGEEQQ